MAKKVLTENGQGSSRADVWIFIFRDWLVETDKFVHCDDMSWNMYGE
jgi:hypothetical protein